MKMFMRMLHILYENVYENSGLISSNYQNVYENATYYENVYEIVKYGSLIDSNYENVYEIMKMFMRLLHIAA
jgi:hypothetical protein